MENEKLQKLQKILRDSRQLTGALYWLNQEGESLLVELEKLNLPEDESQDPASGKNAP